MALERREWSRLSADESRYAALAVPQLDDNILWITEADHHQLVVGSQARILYSDARGRVWPAMGCLLLVGVVDSEMCASYCRAYK